MNEGKIRVRRLRRGYMRWQRYGPDRCMRKRIRIEDHYVTVEIVDPASQSPDSPELPFQ